MNNGNQQKIVVPVKPLASHWLLMGDVIKLTTELLAKIGLRPRDLHRLYQMMRRAAQRCERSKTYDVAEFACGVTRLACSIYFRNFGPNAAPPTLKTRDAMLAALRAVRSALLACAKHLASSGAPKDEVEALEEFAGNVDFRSECVRLRSSRGWQAVDAAVAKREAEPIAEVA